MIGANFSASLFSALVSFNGSMGVTAFAFDVLQNSPAAASSANAPAKTEIPRPMLIVLFISPSLRPRWGVFVRRCVTDEREGKRDPRGTEGGVTNCYKLG